jgi:kynurenine 3-monooxygenase
MEAVTISGAGLAGTLLAIALAQRGYRVELYEQRPDPRAARIDFGRSINLALSARGAHGLSMAGLLPRVLPSAVPMRERSIHSVRGDVAYQPFGRHPEEYLLSVERHGLNAILLDAADEVPNIHVHFGQRVSDIDLAASTMTVVDRATQASRAVPFQTLIATDGAFSAARKVLVDRGVARFDLDELAYGYKELPIRVEQARGMRFESLHLWPRRSFSMIANPNPDGSFGCTLFMPHDAGEPSFAQMKTPADVERLFETHFDDARQRMPSLVEDFFARPTGRLPTVRGGPWFVDGKVLLLGDAAHALVPFFAQGMNSAFEDCTVLLGCVDRCAGRWADVFATFFEARKANTDAIADMAMQNYREIQDHIADERFLLRKHIEHELMRRYPGSYTSMHVLVMFTRVPYAFAHACGALQGRLLDEICAGATRAEDIRWPDVEAKLAVYGAEVRRLAHELHADLDATSATGGAS